jgi:putative transposase
MTDITEHPTGNGKLYCAAVMDAYSRRIIGWSIDTKADTELVVNALAMAVTRRQPETNSTILHSDHGCQYTSWAFGKRLRDAGLLGSMGSVGDCYDNSMMESFWGTMQLELLDTRTWKTREELANAIFEWMECWYNPYRRHSSIGMHSPATFEGLHQPTPATR